MPRWPRLWRPKRRSHVDWCQFGPTAGDPARGRLRGPLAFGRSGDLTTGLRRRTQGCHCPVRWGLLFAKEVTSPRWLEQLTCARRGHYARRESGRQRCCRP